MILDRATIENAKEILDLQKLTYRSKAEIYYDDTLPPLIQTREEIRNDFALSEWPRWVPISLRTPHHRKGCISTFFLI
jgi:hypothetical protein